MPRKLTTKTKETAMPRKLTTQTPGETQTQDPEDDDQGEGLDPSATVSDPDAAIAAGQAGRARKIEKPRAPVAPANLGPRPDSTRAGTANINAKQQTTTAEAIELDRQGKLQRPVLTEAGWYCPQNSLKERAARRKAGDSEFAEIE